MRLSSTGYLGLLLWLITTHALSKGWDIAPGIPLPQSSIDKLHQDFPDIRTAEELSQLLRAINLLAPLAEVLAQDGGDRIVIYAQGSGTVDRIRVNSITRAIRIEVESKVSKYIGLGDSQELRLQLKADIEKILKEQGFFRAKVEIKAKLEKGKLFYEALIDEDYPCQISELEFTFTLPAGISNPFAKGLYCVAEELKEKLAELEINLIQAGYNQSKIQSPELKFDEKTNTALLRISGSLGKKIRYSIQSPIKTPSLITAIFGDELNTIDPSITDPDAMASEITRQYKSQGYDDVEISPARTVMKGAESIEYHFDIKPGPEYLINDLQFEGLNALSPKDASDAMGLYPSLGNTPIFSQDLIQKAREQLQNRYKDLGYWDAKVYDPRVIKNPSNGQVKLVYVIKEGKRRIFKDLSVLGNSALEYRTILKMLDVDEDQPLAWQQLIDFEKNLRNAYKNLGYLQLHMNLELQESRQFRDIETKIQLGIEEGPRARFGEISVKGLIKTDIDIVTRELRFKSGDWFDPQLIEESRQALIDLGLFSSVSIIPSDSNPISKATTISYTVSIREARSGTISFGPGWSLNDGMRFSIESSYNNIGGRGRKIFSKGTLNEAKYQNLLGYKALLGRYAGVGYLEPYLFDLPIDGTITLNHKASARERSWEISRSSEAIASHRIRGFSPRTDLSLFTLYKETREEAEDGVKRATLMESGTLQVREIGLRHVTDGRNNLSWPTRGFRLATEFSLADYVFAGDLKYKKWSINYNLYREIIPNLVIAAGIGYTKFSDIERQDALNVLPTSERLASGGPDNNRGFRDNSLGPVFVTSNSEGKTIEIYDGGSQSASQRLELRYQIIQDTFAVTGFIDASNSSFSKSEDRLIREEFARSEANGEISPEFYDNQPYQLEDLIKNPSYMWTKNYVSYGVSGNFLTPLGSANISLGWPWRRCLNNIESCAYPRGNSNYRQVRGAVLGINVGANF